MSEIVTRVRTHALPAADLEVVMLDQSERVLPYSDAACLDVAAQTMASALAAMGSTRMPVLVEHSGGAVGEWLGVERVERGVDVLIGLYAEGVSAWRGHGGRRDYVSLGATFGADGSVRPFEISLTPTPQFRSNQSEIAMFAVASRANMAYVGGGEPSTERVVTDEEIDRVANKVAEIVVARLAAAAEVEVEPVVEPVPAEMEAGAVLSAIEALGKRVDALARAGQTAANLSAPRPVLGPMPTPTGDAPKLTYAERLAAEMKANGFDLDLAKARISAEG